MERSREKRKRTREEDRDVHTMHIDTRKKKGERGGGNGEN